MDMENIIRGHDVQLARHAVRLTDCERREEENANAAKDNLKKLDRIQWLLITTLMATVAALAKILLLKSA